MIISDDDPGRPIDSMRFDMGETEILLKKRNSVRRAGVPGYHALHGPQIQPAALLSARNRDEKEKCLLFVPYLFNG